MERSSVAFDSAAIRVDGKAKVLLCASLFYFRIPREDWEERMEQLRMTGYNCIDVYLPWNFHELRPDEWHFEEMHDADAFLTLAAKHGLYVIARPGPYICSEWDGGALPAWLHSSDMPLRQNDERYLAYLRRWLEKILPVIAAHEAGRGGSVVAVQLENELDYFACEAPTEYMERLVKIARDCGVTVPLTACAGQCDVQGSGGDAAGISPTFNAYTSPDYPYLENQLAAMREQAARKHTPLMITETDRLHENLKRELLAGARLISPYNQVGGADIDMTNGVSNWAADVHKPLALMASYYDFVSMITVDGQLRPEAAKARLLANLLESMGETLAEGEPMEAPWKPSCNFPTAKRIDDNGDERLYVPALRLANGWLVGVSNMGDQAGTLHCEADGDRLTIPVEAGATGIFPWQMKLTPWGSDVEIVWAEAELTDIAAKDGKLSLTFAGGKAARVKLRDAGTNAICDTSKAQGIANVTVRVVSSDQAMRECSHLPALNCAIPSKLAAKDVAEVAASAYNVREQAVELGDGICTMEASGLYRGDLFYETEMDDDQPILVQNPADFVWIHNANGTTAQFCDGASLLVKGCKGRWTIRAQSWGHVNFDDVREPSLKMEAEKGVASLTKIVSRQDITDLWRIYPEAKYRAQHNDALRETDQIWATSLNTWSFPASPMRSDYKRKIRLREDCDRFWLYVEKNNAEVEALIDGQSVGRLRLNDGWIPLETVGGRTIELCLRVEKRLSHEPLGQVLLYCGRTVGKAKRYGLSAEQWAALPDQATAAKRRLPIALRTGEELLLRDILPKEAACGRTLVLEGTGIEATLLAHDHVCGRVMLKTDGFPEVKGGSQRRVYLPKAWTDASVRLHLCGLSDTAVLERLTWEEIVE